MNKKLLKCPKCGEDLTFLEKKQNPIFGKMEKVLNSYKSPYEKKLALFKCLKEMEVGELTSVEKERIDFLLQGKLYNELAKQCMKEYRKLTAEDFSKKE